MPCGDRGRVQGGGWTRDLDVLREASCATGPLWGGPGNAQRVTGHDPLRAIFDAGTRTDSLPIVRELAPPSRSGGGGRGDAMTSAGNRRVLELTIGDDR